MSFGYQRNNYGNAPYRSNFNRGNFRPQYQGYNNQQQQQQTVKRSGATYSVIRKGNFEGLPIVNAWRKTRYGLMTAKVAPYHKTSKEVTSARNTFLKMICEITINGQTQIHPVLYNTTNKKIVIDKLSLVISPNGSGFTSSGKRVSGFFGANFKRK